jgi:hypothetical protein
MMSLTYGKNILSLKLIWIYKSLQFNRALPQDESRGWHLRGSGKRTLKVFGKGCSVSQTAEEASTYMRRLRGLNVSSVRCEHYRMLTGSEADKASHLPLTPVPPKRQMWNHALQSTQAALHNMYQAKKCSP